MVLVGEEMEKFNRNPAFKNFMRESDQFILDLLNDLRAEDIIERHDDDMVRRKEQTGQMLLLLDILSRRLTSLKQFVDILKRNATVYGPAIEMLGFTVDGAKSATSAPSASSALSMSENDLRQLRNATDTLIIDGEPSEIIDALYGKVFDRTDKESILSEPRPAQMVKLIEIYRAKAPSLQPLIVALRSGTLQPHIADELEKQTTEPDIGAASSTSGAMGSRVPQVMNIPKNSKEQLNVNIKRLNEVNTALVSTGLAPMLLADLDNIVFGEVATAQIENAIQKHAASSGASKLVREYVRRLQGGLKEGLEPLIESLQRHGDQLIWRYLSGDSTVTKEMLKTNTINSNRALKAKLTKEIHDLVLTLNPHEMLAVLGTTLGDASARVEDASQYGPRYQMMLILTEYMRHPSVADWEDFAAAAEVCKDENGNEVARMLRQ